MDIQELQYGNYINYKGKIIKVTSFCAKYNNEIKLNDIEDVYKIEPIELIPEMLEHNDFYYGYTADEEDLSYSIGASLPPDKKGWCWNEDGTIKVIFPKGSDGGLIQIDGTHYINFVFSEKIYVHQFQNLLKICGINKEIFIE